jgi:hypothetical protein
MPVLQEGRFRGVTLAENDVSADAESCPFSRGEKQVHLEPALKSEGESILFQAPVHLRE